MSAKRKKEEQLKKNSGEGKKSKKASPNSSPPYRLVRELRRAHGLDLGPGGDREDREGDVVGLEEHLWEAFCLFCVFRVDGGGVEEEVERVERSRSRCESVAVFRNRRER